MAEELERNVFALNNLLCFLVSKQGKADSKRLKETVRDFFTQTNISGAKKQLLVDIAALTVSGVVYGQFPRFPERHGDRRTERELEDIFDIVQTADERGLLSKLPTYVSDNPEKMPSIKLEDGDLRFLLSKIDKLEAMILGLQTAVHASLSKAHVYVGDTSRAGATQDKQTLSSTKGALPAGPAVHGVQSVHYPRRSRLNHLGGSNNHVH